MTSNDVHIQSAGTSPAKRLPYELLLVLAAAIWGLGTVVIKGAVDEFPTAWLVGIRFAAAGILLSLVLLPRMRRTLKTDALRRRSRRTDAASGAAPAPQRSHLGAGAVLGAFVALTYLCNTTGLAYTTASRSSFLTATYCVIVPFLAWALMRKKPSAFNVSAALLCLVGLAFVALPGNAAAEAGHDALSLLAGDALTLASALFCGLHIVLIAKFAPGKDMLVLTALQFLVAGAIALAWAALTQEPPQAHLFTGDMLGNLAYLVVFATCLTLALQNLGLAHVAPAPAALLLSTEAVFGVAFSLAFLHETLTAAVVLGFALIFAAILVSEWLPNTRWGRRKTR